MCGWLRRWHFLLVRGGMEGWIPLEETREGCDHKSCRGSWPLCERDPSIKNEPTFTRERAVVVAEEIGKISSEGKHHRGRTEIAAELNKLRKDRPTAYERCTGAWSSAVMQYVTRCRRNNTTQYDTMRLVSARKRWRAKPEWNSPLISFFLP